MIQEQPDPGPDRGIRPDRHQGAPEDPVHVGTIRDDGDIEDLKRMAGRLMEELRADRSPRGELLHAQGICRSANSRAWGAALRTREWEQKRRITHVSRRDFRNRA